MDAGTSLDVLTVRGVPITIGDLRAALTAAPAFQAALGDILAGKAGLNDAEVLTSDALAVMGFVPGIGQFVTMAKVAIVLFELAAAFGITISPDPDPIHDGQTSDTAHSGRRGG
jgi:hypothetical protein